MLALFDFKYVTVCVHIYLWVRIEEPYSGYLKAILRVVVVPINLTYYTEHILFWSNLLLQCN